MTDEYLKNALIAALFASDSATIGPLSVSHREGKPWYVYDGNKEYHFKSGNDLKGFPNIFEAFFYMIELPEAKEWMAQMGYPHGPISMTNDPRAQELGE